MKFTLILLLLKHEAVTSIPHTPRPHLLNNLCTKVVGTTNESLSMIQGVKDLMLNALVSIAEPVVSHIPLMGLISYGW